MRNLPEIENLWQEGGPFIGSAKPVTRVLVQLPWPDLAGTNRENDFLQVNLAFFDTPRWWQNAANDAPQREIPNINNVGIDRTIDQDAGTIDITMSNQWMYDNDNIPVNARELGRPGYFTYDYGETLEARARWGHETNEWNNVLVPNALLRVFTGFGGAREHYPDVWDAVADGKLALYGVFLLDEVQVTSDGEIQMHGRDMAKLLVDQQLYPPLVPYQRYPLTYYRWDRDRKKVQAASKEVPVVEAPTAGVSPGNKNATYSDSEVDRWYGANTSLHGHQGSHALDNDPQTFYLSVGNSGPSKSFSTVWLEVDCGEAMNAIYLHPWAGRYTVYVSVMEGGSWQGEETVPYDHTPLIGNQSHVVDTGADIPYVAAFRVPWEEARDYVLPRVYNADKVRVSFRELHDSGIGVWRYRAGIREMRVKGITNTESVSGAPTSSSASSETVTQEPFTLAAGPVRNPEKTYSHGYVTATIFDQVDAFGDARYYDRGNYADEDLIPVSVTVTHSGEGYYVLSMDGRLGVHGDAVWYGDPASGSYDSETHGAIEDLALTPSGEGYWICAGGGKVFAYGDATDWNVDIHVPTIDHCTAIASNLNDQGFWLLRTDGQVFSYGAATVFGTWPYDELQIEQTSGDMGFEQINEHTVTIQPTLTGQGYWILTTSGRVRAYGDAKNHGEPVDLLYGGNVFTDTWRELLPAPDDRGYLLLHGSGKMVQFGDAKYFGEPTPGTEAELRHDGNLTDYSDVARDLALWSGFLFEGADHSPGEPAPVYGAIESTGAWPEERLPDDIFDKRPVIDALTQIREVVGYICRVDQQGRFVWSSSNTWHIGNFDENGYHIEHLPVVDERHNCTSYTVSTSDTPLRSLITIASHDPWSDYSGIVNHSYEPQSAKRLRGMSKPAAWFNEWFQNPDEQVLMAELIGLQIAFQERMGQVSCVASPHIDIDDQVRILERRTGEVNVHYVRGVNFSHDLESGNYSMTLTTHWLAAGEGETEIVGSDAFPASSLLLERIQAGQFGKYYVDTGKYLSP